MLSPKQKAAELVGKLVSYQPMNEWVICSYDAHEMAKKGAIITVEEILDVDCVDMSEAAFNAHIEYWTQVENELNAL